MDGFLFTESFLDTPLDEYGNPAPELMGLDGGPEITGTYGDVVGDAYVGDGSLRSFGDPGWFAGYTDSSYFADAESHLPHESRPIPPALREAEPLGSIYTALEKIEAHEPDPGRTTEPVHPDDWLAVDLGGHRFTVPAESATASLTIHEPDRFNILSDRDGDGLIDHISAITYDGTWTAWQVSGGHPAGAESAGVAGEGGVVTGGEEVEDTGGVTPDQAGEKGQGERWECVEWGQWG